MGFAIFKTQVYVGGRNFNVVNTDKRGAIVEILRLFQQKVNVVFLTHGWSYWETLEMVAQLISEIGEVADEVHFLCGTKKPRIGEKQGDVEAEIGDVLLALACYANSKGYSLAIAFDRGVCGEEDGYKGHPPLFIIAQLSHRVGVFADEISAQYEKGICDEGDYDCTERKIGNILRMIKCLADRIGYSFEGAMRKVLEKIEGKDKDRFPEGK